MDSNVIDTLLREATVSSRLRLNLNLRNNGERQSQRMLNGLQLGTILPIHRHHRGERWGVYTAD
ncbi:WbuC family cupin fold metalloprotein [Bacteroides hominis]|uniref:WbuC family cupin fold metalloprotein n=1 Tax=Bacteroides TaxID=816 RepID=UPI0039C1A467